MPPVSYLDATSQEEGATPLRLLLVFSFHPTSPPDLQAMRMLGPGELDLARIKILLKVHAISFGLDYSTHVIPPIQDGEKYAKDLFTAMNVKLKEEDIRRNQKARDRFEQR